MHRHEYQAEPRHAIVGRQNDAYPDVATMCGHVDTSTEEVCIRLPADHHFVDPRPPAKRPMDNRLRRLEMIRRRIPYAYWLVYDLVFMWLLVYGLVNYSLWFAVGLPFLAVSTFFDIVEFIVKATEERWQKRLFEGTGAPTSK